MSFITYTRCYGKLSLGQARLVQWNSLQAQGTATWEVFHYAENKVTTVLKEFATWNGAKRWGEWRGGGGPDTSRRKVQWPERNIKKEYTYPCMFWWMNTHMCRYTYKLKINRQLKAASRKFGLNGLITHADNDLNSTGTLVLNTRHRSPLSSLSIRFYLVSCLKGN